MPNPLILKGVADGERSAKLASLGVDSLCLEYLGGMPGNLRDVAVEEISTVKSDTIKTWRVGSAFGLMLTASQRASAQSYDPEGSGVIVSAVEWLQGTLMGTVATVAAVIAVAVVGFMMLTGRINWRHGAVVIFGCFILFGAASIVAGIRAAAIG